MSEQFLEPSDDRISGLVSKVTSELLEEITRATGPKDPEFSDQIGMLKHSFLGTIAEITTLIAVMEFGTYSHENPDIVAWVEKNIEDMDTNWSTAIGSQANAKFFGYSTSEWDITSERIPGEWMLDHIGILHPEDYVFRVQNRRLFDVLDRSTGTDLAIPIERCVVISNNDFLSFGNPILSVGDCTKAWSYFKALQLTTGELIVTGQRQAVPLLHGQADGGSQVKLLNADGSPLKRNGQDVYLPSVKNLDNELRKLGNRKVITTDLETKIQAINYQTDGKFLIELALFFKKMCMLSFAFPETILETGEGGLGNSGLNEGHMKLLSSLINGINDKIRKEFIYKIFKPLIYWKFGEQETYGEFIPPESDTEDKLKLLEIIIDGITKGAFSNEDIAVVNTTRRLAGIPELTELAPVEGTNLNSRYWRATR